MSLRVRDKTQAKEVPGDVSADACSLQHNCGMHKIFLPSFPTAISVKEHEKRMRLIYLSTTSHQQDANVCSLPGHSVSRAAHSAAGCTNYNPFKGAHD